MRKKSFKRIVAVILLLAGTLVGFEVAARVLLPTEVKRSMYAQVRDILVAHPEHVRFSSTTGFIIAPSIQYNLRTSEFATDIRTNSQGLRDDEESLEEPDVLILGDSFVFGTGVSNGRTVSDCLEKQLGLRVLNGGIPCYGTLQELRLLQDLFEQNIVAKQHVFIFFYSGNDLRNNLGYAGLRSRPYLVRGDDDYEVVEPLRADFKVWLDNFERLRYPSICEYSYTAYLLVRIEKALICNRSEWPKTDYSDSLGAFQHVALAFAELDSVPKPIFVYVPAIPYYESDLERRRGDKEFSKISSILSCVGLQLLDLRAVLTHSDYYQYDGHWRESGHKKAAQFLACWLREGTLSAED